MQKAADQSNSPSDNSSLNQERQGVTVFGAGSWGLALAQVAASNGHRPLVWVYEQSDFEELSTSHRLVSKLPSLQLSPEIRFTTDANSAAAHNSVWLLAVPAQTLSKLMHRLKPQVHDKLLIINVAKGIELSTGRRMSQVISDDLGIAQSAIVSLSGPSHAEEVAVGMPTTVVAAGASPAGVAVVQQMFSNARLRVYASDDLIGVELGGALKNVVAIACGIAVGLGLGDNTMGALVTRGLAEITRLGVVLGAKPETFAGLSGIGDLVTTAISRHSRNRHVGERIGRGESLAQVLSSMSMVAEGVETARATRELARKHAVEMPITEAVCQVLFETKNPKSALQELMTRSLKTEVWR